MSGEHQPSYSAQQTGSENGDYYDDLLGVETFDARDFERDFGDFEFSDFPEEPTSKQDVVPTETPLSHGKPQENQPNAEVRSYVDANESAELQEVSSLQDIIPADRVSSCDQPQVVQSNGEHETHFDLNDFEDGEDSLDHQNSISPQNSFGNDQLEGGLNNSQPLFQFEFSAEDWKAYDDHMANEDFPEIPDTETQHGQRIERRLEKAKSSGDSKHHSRQQHHAYQHVGPVYHDPYSPGNIDDSSNLTESPMDSRQWSAVNTPAMDSGYGTAAMSRETTHALMSATPYQLGNTVGHSSSGNMQGASYDMYAAANSPTDDTHGAYDEDDEEEDVPSQPTFETFEERDPLIVQNPRKAKWGQTGTRNGLEVWFNPETSKWRKLQTPPHLKPRYLT